MELFITFLYPSIRGSSPRPLGCKDYPELPCELTEKLTGDCRAHLVSSNLEDTSPIFHILYTRGVLLMPPQVGQNPVGATTKYVFVFIDPAVYTDVCKKKKAN